MAEGTALHIPSIGADPPPTGEDQIPGSVGAPGGPRAEVLEVRDNSFSIRLSVAPPSTQ